MCQLAIHTQNIESCSNISIAPKEILGAPGLQSQECKLLELIPRICASTKSSLCPRGFVYSPFFLGYTHLSLFDMLLATRGGLGT
jgi:hypothetical protein